MQFTRTKELRPIVHDLIPGGAHTYAKGDDQYPEEAPGYIVRGEGCHVWDVDGNEFIEYGMGLRSVTLGHGHKRVVEAAYRQMQLGSNFVRPAAIEFECAQALMDVVRGHDMVKFAKNGSDVTSAAIKLARAHTGRDMVAYCADHPFFATNDWFIGTTPMYAGIPQVVRDLTVKFRYNDLASVQALFDKYPNQIACLIMEAETMEPPRDNFLHKVRDLCHANGAIFIIDEIITGFRWHMRGAQYVHNIVPDLTTFGKALANGFSLAALMGRRDLMELGGLRTDKERVWLLSTTYGAETFSLAAAMEVMRIYQEEPVVERMMAAGERLARGANQVAAELGIEEYFQVIGRPSNLVYATKDQNKERSQPFRTLFMQEIIKRGVIGPSFVISYAHTDEDVDRTIEAVAGALVVYRQALEEGVDKYLVGRPVKPAIRTHN